MLSGITHGLRGIVRRIADVAHAATRPARMIFGLLRGMTQSHSQLVAENALLRQQLIIAARSIKRPRVRVYERGLLVLLARLVPRWKDAPLLVKPGAGRRGP